MSWRRIRLVLVGLLVFSICIRLACTPAAAKAANSLIAAISSSEAVARLALGYFKTIEPEVTASEAPSPTDSLRERESAATPTPRGTPAVSTPAVTLATGNALVYQPPSRQAHIELTNKTSYAPDIPALLEEELGFALPAVGPQVLIVHTHGSEAYFNPDSTETRSTDPAQSVVRVGDVLAEELANRGFYVLHDRTMYDCPTYSGSYTRSLAAVEEWLAQWPGITVVLDIHRDSITEADGSKWRSDYGGDSAQVMLLAANGENGLEHPNWMKNFKFALRLQAAMEDEYSGLARPLCLSGDRYNQHAAPGYLIMEVGSDGNTLAEAEKAVRLFADAASEVLQSMIEEQ